MKTLVQRQYKQRINKLSKLQDRSDELAVNFKLTKLDAFADKKLYRYTPLVGRKEKGGVLQIETFEPKSMKIYGTWLQ